MATGPFVGGAGRSMGGAGEGDRTYSGELQRTVLKLLSCLALDLPSDHFSAAFPNQLLIHIPRRPWYNFSC
jgi:hypothetical protein